MIDSKKLLARINEHIASDRVPQEETEEFKRFKPTSQPRLHLSTEPYYLYKSLEEGINDLYRLCETSNKESSFIYVPRKQEWINITKSFFNGTLENGEGGYDGVINVNLDYSTEGNEVYNIHTHLRYSEKKGLKAQLEYYKKVLKKSSKTKRKNLKYLLKKVSTVQAILPSLGDVMFYSGDRDNQDSSVKINHVVVSEYGVTQITLRKETPSQEIISEFERVSDSYGNLDNLGSINNKVFLKKVIQSMNQSAKGFQLEFNSRN